MRETECTTTVNMAEDRKDDESVGTIKDIAAIIRQYCLLMHLQPAAGHSVYLDI